MCANGWQPFMMCWSGVWIGNKLSLVYIWWGVCWPRSPLTTWKSSQDRDGWLVPWEVLERRQHLSISCWEIPNPISKIAWTWQQTAGSGSQAEKYVAYSSFLSCNCHPLKSPFLFGNCMRVAVAQPSIYQESFLCVYEYVVSLVVVKFRASLATKT